MVEKFSWVLFIESLKTWCKVLHPANDLDVRSIFYKATYAMQTTFVCKLWKLQSGPPDQDLSQVDSSFYCKSVELGKSVMRRSTLCSWLQIHMDLDRFLVANLSKKALQCINAKTYSLISFLQPRTCIGLWQKCCTHTCFIKNLTYSFGTDTWQ